jgi:hypothetical protein
VIPRSDDFGKYSVETQIALLRQDVVALHQTVAELRADVQALEKREALNEAQVRELCRSVVTEEAAGTYSVRDNMMRVVTFAVSIGTAIFVIRGGR